MTREDLPSSQVLDHGLRQTSSRGNSPQMRVPLWEGQDVARLAFREAQIRERMNRRREQMNLNTVVTDTGNISGSPSLDVYRTPLASAGNLLSPCLVPRTTLPATPNDRCRSPLDTGLQQIHCPLTPSIIGTSASNKLLALEDEDEFAAWSTYFADPYRSPSVTSQTVSVSNRRSQAMTSPLRILEDPSVLSYDSRRRSSSPFHSLNSATGKRVSSLLDLDLASKSLRRASCASLVAGHTDPDRLEGATLSTERQSPPRSSASTQDEGPKSCHLPISSQSLQSLTFADEDRLSQQPPQHRLPELPERLARTKIGSRRSEITNIRNGSNVEDSLEPNVSDELPLVGLGFGWMANTQNQPRFAADCPMGHALRESYLINGSKGNLSTSLNTVVPKPISAVDSSSAIEILTAQFPLPPARVERTMPSVSPDNSISFNNRNLIDQNANLASDSDCASIQPRDDLHDPCRPARTTSIGLLSHRSSTSSATTATSDLQLTPRHSLENITRYPLTTPSPKKKSLSCNHHPESSDHLTLGNLQDMISEAERDQALHSKLEFHVVQDPPNPLPRRLLLPPGPDASYWGEPEIMLSDLDFSPSDGKYSVDKTPFRSRTSLTRTALPILTRTKIPAATRHPYSTTLSTAERTGDQAKWMMSVLPLALGLSKLRSLPIVRAGSSVVRNVGRIGTAVTALRYASPIWTRISERSSKNYDGHVPLNWFENTFLAAGSGVIGVADTKRGDLVALLSETSSQSSMPALHATMRSLPEGRQILQDRPLISSNTINLEQLRTLQRGTLGREWVEWLVEGGVTPDTRHEVAHIDSPVLAYTMTRYRQTHDLYHTLFSLPPTLPYELTLKVLELSNMSLPVAGLSSTFGPFRLSSARRAVWRADWASWALRQGAQSRPLVGVYWEKRWEQGLGDLRRELGVQRMDDAAVIGRWKAYRQIREAERELRKKGDWIDEPENW